jgi:hypothetical protein
VEERAVIVEPFDLWGWAIGKVQPTAKAGRRMSSGLSGTCRSN